MKKQPTLSTSKELIKHIALLLLSLVTIGVEAQKSYYIAGSTKMTGSNWQVTDNNKLTVNADSIGTITYNLEPGTYMFKVTDNENWWGRADGKNMVQTIYKEGELIIDFDIRTKKISVRGEVIDYEKSVSYKNFYLSGSKGLTGHQWGVHEELKFAFGADSVGTITIKDVQPGTYPFKITDSLHWWGDNGNADYHVTVEEPCDLTIVYDGYTRKAVCRGEHLGIHKLNAEKMYLTGTLFGNWDATENNRMTQISEGLFSIKVEDVKPGVYQIKFTTDEDWIDSWGTMTPSESGTKYDAVFEGFNINIKVSKKSTLECFFDISKYNTQTQDGAVYWFNLKE